jgi:murein L,D-transpeptidase YafK
MDRRKFLTTTFLGIAGLTLMPLSCTVLKSESTLNPDLETTLKSDSKKYNGWVRYALRQSKKENVILINKSEYTLDFLADAKILLRCPVELGFGPLDDKQVEGDGSTPEGIYSASKKIPAQQSKYYKAILIDYPTAENWQNFNKKKADGIIPPHAQIHGTGSGVKGNDVNEVGSNWTSGCVALSNKDMDQLYDMVRLGTPIIIVRYTSVKYK